MIIKCGTFCLAVLVLGHKDLISTLGKTPRFQFCSLEAKHGTVAEQETLHDTILSASSVR